MPTITRFAPSPTGRLHVGNIRTALHNWMLAKKAEGHFLLRIDDTDAARGEERFVDAIREDLAWLGLVPDSEERQSNRLSLYARRAEELITAGRLYPCWESPRELDLKRKVQLGRGMPPVYDRAALQLTEGEKQGKYASGDMPHWRFRLDHEGPIGWDDGIRGAQRFDPEQLSDPVVRRADGSWLYMLPSVIDDVDMGITDVLRGEDHVSNTAVQIQMFTALDATPPRFAHESLLVGAEGKLSKRLGSLDCVALRNLGIEPEALVSLLARLGTSLPVDPELDQQTLVTSFDLSTFGRAPARFDIAELERVNTALIHRMPYIQIAHQLPDGMDQAGWEAIRPNLSTLAEVQDWWHVVTGPIDTPELDDDTRAYLMQARDSFAWSADPWHDLTATLKTLTGRKGRALFLPLRLALTGRDHGPDMASLLPLIGETEARRRLTAASG